MYIYKSLLYMCFMYTLSRTRLTKYNDEIRIKNFNCDLIKLGTELGSFNIKNKLHAHFSLITDLMV